MEENFKEISVENINDNVFKLIDKDWMLITAGTIDDFNAMTASWGSFGILWHKQVAFCFIRPNRHTYGLMEKNEYFTLSFYSEKHKKILEFCGTKSGRNVDKIKETGLLPVKGATGAVYFGQARLVLECRKIYYQDLDPQKFLDPEIHKNYPIDDYHRMYIGEVLGCMLNQ